MERAAYRALALGDVDAAARCAAAVLWVCTARGPFGAGLALANAVLDAGPPASERARLLLGVGTLQAKLGEWHEARSTALAAAVGAVAVDDPWLESQACNLVASMTDNVGTDRDGVVAYQRRSLTAVRRAGLQDGTTEDREAALHRRLGQREDQRTWLRRAQRRAAEVGNRPLWWKVTCLLGQEERTDGDFVTARAMFEQVLRACEGPALRAARLQAVTLLVEMVFMMGDRDAGRQWAQATVDLARQMGSRVDECRGYLALAHATLDLADLEPIDGALCTSPAFAIVESDAEVLRAQLLRERGAFERSVRAAERAVEIDEAAGSPDPSIAISELAMSLLAAGRVARAREVFDRLAAPVGVYRVYRRCQAALLERAEGRRTELEVADLRALAEESGVPLPDDADGVLSNLLGPWAVAVWARGPV